MKALIIVCDGMADRPLKELDMKTPLEFAKTPKMDEMARGGICGILDPIAPGVRVGSDTSHLALLGYDAYKVYTGRGPFEAAGVGLEVLPGDIAFRCNFATVDEDLKVKDRRAGRIREGTRELAEAVNKIKAKDVKIFFKESTTYRAALVLRGRGLSYRVSDSDPHFVGAKVRWIEPLDDSPEAKRTSKVLNEFLREVHETLKMHEVNLKRIEDGKPPANMILLRGAGVVPHLSSFEEVYHLKGACISTVGLLRGIGRMCGLDVIEVETDIRIKDICEKALKALKNHEFLLLNIKDADNAAHDKNAQKKVAIIEEIDKCLSIFSDFMEDDYLVLLSDHTTTISYGDHTGDPVPIVICGPEVRTDDVIEFNERAVAKGGLNRIEGRDVMNILMNLMYRSEKFGA
ncbi:MAG: 2,3-bisphosphoglycerate-independent phosphoglycerate mutase [Candidatus Hydrothermarchaeales archaeon]